MNRSLYIVVLLAGSLLSAGALATAVFFNLDGKPAAIEKFTDTDSWTVVMIWASDCHVCNAESGAYEDFYNRNKDNGVQVLGISLDGIENRNDAQGFIDRNGITFPNLVVDGAAGADFYTSQTGEAWVGTPTFMIYGPSGVLKAAQIGAVPPKIIEEYISNNR